ncbi:MAG: hypothetical protein WAT19_07920 [Ferruginibacter sp.]
MTKPDQYSYFFELPLYTKIKLEDTEVDYLLSIINCSEKIDAYNPALKENTTYSFSAIPRIDAYSSIRYYTGIYRNTIKCVRTGEEFYAFSYFDANTSTLQKVGQYLSIADFHISQIKQYGSVLQTEQLKELTRAIGLAANGVGIGSFVYLRRVFETLLEEAHQKAIKDDGWQEETFTTARVSEKIELLQNHLPKFLVENKVLYGILSKGIHSLTEDECLAYFETVKVGIELILDEKLEAFEKLKKVEEAKRKISILNSKLK